MDLTIVIPVFNEKDSLNALFASLTRVLAPLKKEYEIIFVDDGSTDNSLQELKKFCNSERNVKIIQLNRNYGQTAAINAGFSEAKGEIVITMDSDLQNDPADIPVLIQTMGNGFDVVSGWRANRKDNFLFKKIPSAFSNFLVRKLTGLKLHDSGCTLKAYRKKAIEDLKLYGEMHRYIPYIVAMRGFKVGEVKVAHHSRKYGTSKYGTGRLLRGFLDLVFLKFWSDYSTRPLHFFGMLGFLSMFLGILVGVLNLSYYWFIIGKLNGVGPLLLLSALLLLIGIQIIFFGFLAEIMIRNFYATEKNRPYYIERILK